MIKPHTAGMAIFIVHLISANERERESQLCFAGNGTTMVLLIGMVFACFSQFVSVRLVFLVLVLPWEGGKRYCNAPVLFRL